jgi:hypothetical protein
MKVIIGLIVLPTNAQSISRACNLKSKEFHNKK